VNDVIVLCYHAISRDWEADLSTTPERFEYQIELLAKRGYRGATFTEAVLAPGSGRVAAITFDDAYRSVIELARPILDRFGFRATVFAPSAHIGSERPMQWPGIDHWLGGRHERELIPMSWQELSELATAGWEIGSHTVTHPHLTQLDDTALAEELERSKQACEQHLGRPCPSLAYPYGDVDERVVVATAAAGYTTAAALPTRLDARGPLEWPRVGVYRADDDARFRLKVSPTVLMLRRSGAWRLAETLRARVGR
jgi:peptidoglycan/xylan/chitin deacetylase (PgdA/CDA1 family)